MSFRRHALSRAGNDGVRYYQLHYPISLNAVVLEESLIALIYALGVALVPLIAGMLLKDGSIANVVPLLVGTLLTSFCFATMGALSAAYPTESPGNIMTLPNPVRFPLTSNCRKRRGGSPTFPR